MLTERLIRCEHIRDYDSLMLSRSVSLVLRFAVSCVIFVVGVLCSLIASSAAPFATRDGQPTETAAVASMVAAVFWVTVFFRRRAPLVPFIAGALLTLAWADCVLLLVAVFHLVSRSPRRIAVITAVIGGVLTVAGAVRLSLGDPRSSPFGVVLLDASEYASVSEERAAEIIILTCAATALGLFFSIGGGMLVRQMRRAKRAESRAEVEGDKNALLAAEVARQSERQALARELHDTLSNRLSVLSLHAGALEVGDDPDAKQSAQALRSQAHAALEDLRGVIEGVRTADVQRTAASAAEAGLDGIPALIDSAAHAGVSVFPYVVLRDVDTFPNAIGLAAYRIVQESLTNAMKHAPGQPIRLSVRSSAHEGVRLRIVNSLPDSASGQAQQGGARGVVDLDVHEGPDAVRAAVADSLALTGSGAGIEGMRTRAEAFGGSCEVGVHEGEFVVDAFLPPTAEA